jgi:hypothetical protein
VTTGSAEKLPWSRGKLRLLLWALRLLVVGSVLFGGATARVLWSGEKEIQASTAGLLAGDPREASVHARRAAGWYAPGAPHVRVAYERLEALARAAEAQGDREEALFAWRAIRSASLETRWLFTPHADALDRANRAIARMEAEAPRAPNLRDAPPAQLERAFLEQLRAQLSPRAPWVLVLLGGLLLWVSGLVWMLLRGLDSRGLPAWRRSAPALACSALGAALWALALLFA